MDNIKFNSFDSIINNINIEILEHGYLLADSSWKHFNITSPFNRLYFVLKGEGYVYNKSQRVALTAGNAYLIPADTEFNYVCDKYIEKFYLHFRAEVFHVFDIFESLNSCMIYSFNPSELQYFISRAKNGGAGDIIFCKAYLLNTVAIFKEMLAPGQDLQFNNAHKYRDVFKYLKTYCHAGITTKDVADYAGFPVSGFTRNFKKDMGLTVKEYMEQALANKAKEELLLTDKRVKEIAYELKFSDEFYFSRFFKRHTGLSPRSYRLKNRV